MASGGSGIAMFGFAIVNAGLLFYGVQQNPEYTSCIAKVAGEVTSGAAADTACLAKGFHVPAWHGFMDIVTAYGGHSAWADVGLAVAMIIGMTVLILGQGSS